MSCSRLPRRLYALYPPRFSSDKHISLPRTSSLAQDIRQTLGHPRCYASKGGIKPKSSPKPGSKSPPPSKPSAKPVSRTPSTPSNPPSGPSTPASARIAAATRPTTSSGHKIPPESSQNTIQPSPSARINASAAPNVSPISKTAPVPLRTNIPLVSRAHLDPGTSYAAYLSSAQEPTLLYRAPTSRIFIQTCYVTGGFALAIGMYNFYDFCVLEHPGIHPLVVPGMAGACFLICVTGIWLLWPLRRLVGSISAVPGAGGARTLMVRLQGRRVLPFLRPREMLVPPQHIYMPMSVAEMRQPDPVNPNKKRTEMIARLKEEEGGEELKLRTYACFSRALGMLGLASVAQMTGSVVFVSWYSNVKRRLIIFVDSVLSSFRMVLSREGLAYVFVRAANNKEVKWRMDVYSGWLLNEGIPLERLARKYRDD